MAFNSNSAFSDNSFLYAIQNKEGLFSVGGQRPQFRKKGKLWKKSALISHLNIALSENKHIYDDCKIIRYVVKLDFDGIEDI